MKTKIKFIIQSFLVIAITIFITRCKTPVETKKKITDISIVALADDTTVLSDTVEIVIGSLKTAVDIMEPCTPLTIIVKGLASPTAPLIVGVYNSSYKFLYKEGRLKEYTFIPTGNTLIACINDIKYGEIAIVIYQDMNGNGTLDKNFIGLPTEGYCFSKNFVPKVKAPDYDDCKFYYASETDTVKMYLIK